jgi:hypothetical protein
MVKEMARYKETHIILTRIPIEDYFELLKYTDRLAPLVRSIIKKYLNQKKHETNEKKQMLPKTAQGYCNNPTCKYGQIPEKIQLLFDEKKQAWYCSHCQEFTPDIDETTIKINKQ